MDNQLDALVDISMQYQKAKRKYMWMPTSRNRKEYVQLANLIAKQKRLITTAMVTSQEMNKINIHSHYNTEER